MKSDAIEFLRILNFNRFFWGVIQFYQASKNKIKYASLSFKRKSFNVSDTGGCKSFSSVNAGTDILCNEVTAPADQEEYNLYFQHDPAIAGVNLGIETGTFNNNSTSTYSHSNYPSTIPVSSVASNNCMYEQHAYVDHQGGGVGVYLPWSHTPNNVGALLQRTYHYGNSNGYVPPQQHQPTSPEDRSDSAQSYVSSPPSCTSLHSPVASPVAVVANTNFAYSSCSSSRSNSNCNSPAGQQAQHQSSYQELYSPVSFNLNFNIKCFHSILISLLTFL